MNKNQAALPLSEAGGQPPRPAVRPLASADALRADVAAILARSGELPQVLHQCCAVLVDRLGVAFARIWTLLPDEQVLKLQASAGLYMGLDGSHARVSVGQYKIGLIASQRRPHLTNRVLGDELVHDQTWARREGMTAFAGYPLLAEGVLVGVLAMFSRQEISPEDFANLEIIAGIIANYVRRKQSEEALQESEARFRRLAEGIGVIPWQADARSWRFTYVGPQAAKILGYPVEQWYTAEFWIEHIHPEDRSGAIEICRQRTERGDEHYQFEYRMFRADGAVVWFLDIVNVISDERGPKTLQGFLIDITERKRAEQAVQESRQRLQVMADALPVLIAYVDADERYQFNNAAFEQWFGIAREELRGRPMRDILGPAAYGALREHVRAALAGQSRSFDERVSYQGAGTRDVHVDYVPHQTADGKVAGFFAMTIDMSARKAAEEALRESQQWLQLITDSLPVLISYIDAQERYQFNNAAYEQWFGIPRDQLRGRPLREILGPAAYETLREYVKAALSGEPRSFAGKVPYHGAGTRDVQVEYIPHRTCDGKVAGFFALIIDMSARKAAEEALRDREARLSAILNTAVDAIITIDEAGVIESVNPSAERLFGYAAAELLGRNVSMLMPAPYAQQHGSYLQNYLSTGVNHLIGRGRELSARRKDGSIFPIELSVSEVHDGKLWYTGIVHDLSRRKALERQVLDASAQEQQRIAQELHDGVGQELTGLGLMADALARRLADNGPAERKLADKLVQGLQRVHEQIRTLCRGLILTELDPDALRVALADLAASTTEQTGVTCTLECPDTIPLADSQTARHLYRIVQEAVANALRHGRPRHIWLSLRATPEELHVGVRDDGVGVQQPPGGEKGMGIPTMQYRAGMIGGVLRIGPGEGAGTLVTCTIPRSKYVGPE